MHSLPPLLKAIDVVKDYDSAGHTLRSIDHVSLDIQAGTFLSIMGPSGSGKSTLLHLLGGLDRPSSGQVLLHGQDMQDLSSRKLSNLRRRHFGFIFQFFSLISVLTLEQNVALPGMISRVPRKDFQGWLDSVLMTVGLSDRRDKLPLTLSGGEQQRAAIARALIMKPEVILADEPTGNLDSRSGDAVLRLLRGIKTDQGRTVVMVTHDPHAASFSDSVSYLRDGRIIGTRDLTQLQGGDSRRRSVRSWLQQLEDQEEPLDPHRAGN
ncbi:MAG: ABC transporter ATP-binding protein [Actinomycetota bacterium]|nr:ABC transporter ATP-binding protein [Actinomycetota bacterium]